MTVQPETITRRGLFPNRAHTHIAYMNRIAIALALSIGLALPVAAQEGRDDMKDGFSLFGEGARLMLRGLMSELAPMLEDMEGVLSDLSAYHAPEVLPNGDIILRRKVPPAPDAAPDGAPGQEREPAEEIDI